MTARTVLRDYQEQALAAVLAPPSGVNRQLLEMATGAGKTVTFAALLHRVLKPGQRGLVLAHREELLEQAAAKIAAIDPDLHVELERGVAVARLEASLFSADARKIVVASIQTLHAARLKHWPRDAFAYVICDEAHHGIASAYQRIFEHFGCMEGRTPLLGVTATPMRTIRTERLESVFQRTAASVGIVDLVARGHLVPIRVRRIASAADLREVKSVAGDFKADALEEAIDIEDRNELVVESYLAWGDGRKAVVFAAGVAHARHIAARFNGRGVPTETVWGEMAPAERRAALARFRTGETRMLCNMGVLLEGYDEPSIGVVILARPTQSAIVLTQSVGRGTRLYPGKDHLLVLDVQDVASDARPPLAAATIADFDREYDPQGGDIFTQRADFLRLDPRLQDRVKTAADLADLLAAQERARQKRLLASRTPARTVPTPRPAVPAVVDPRPWQEQPATPRQKAALRACGRSIPYDLTKGAASEMIAQLYGADRAYEGDGRDSVRS